MAMVTSNIHLFAEDEIEVTREPVTDREYLSLKIGALDEITIFGTTEKLDELARRISAAKQPTRKEKVPGDTR